MRRIRQLAGRWRPRTGTAVIGAVLAVAGAGVGWAATRAISPGVITACVGPPGASPALQYSPNGTCATGQTIVQWNQQGPQGLVGPQGLEGPPGQQGTQGPPGQSATTTGPVIAWGPSKYSNGFTISGIVTTRGNYAFEAQVDEKVTLSPHAHTGGFGITCSLLSGPPNGSATELTSSTQPFTLIKHPLTLPHFTWSPPSYTGPAYLGFAQFVSASQVPLEVYYTCKRTTGLGAVIFTNPALTLSIAQSLHLHVGPALPIQPVVGPGPLRKVNGNG